MADLTPEQQKQRDQDEYEYLKLKAARAMQSQPDVGGAISTLGNNTRRAVDYAFGPTRTAIGLPATAIADLVQKVRGKPANSFQPQEDVKRTLMGDAPTLNEYATRMGVPPGPSVSDVTDSVPKGSAMDFTTRGTMAGVGDMLLPGIAGKAEAAKALGMTAASLRKTKFAEEAAKIKMAASPLWRKALDTISGTGTRLGEGTLLGKGAEDLGAGIHASGMNKIAPPEPGLPNNYPAVALREGIYGSPETINAQNKLLQAKLGDKIGAAEKEARGVETLINRRALTNDIWNEAHDLHINGTTPELKEAGNKFKQVLDDWTGRGGTATLDEVIRLKREHMARADKAGQYAADPNYAHSAGLSKKLAAAARKEVENALDKVNENLGGEYRLNNSDYGAVGEAIPKIAASKPEGLAPHRGDYLAAGLVGAGTRDPIMTAATMAAMHMQRTPTFRTTLGYGLNKLGQTGALDPLARKALLEGFPSQSPWSLLDKKDK